MHVDLSTSGSPTGLIPPQLNADIATTGTGADGAYRFEGLVDGKYTVRAYDPAGIYATTYYTHTPWLYVGELIEISNGASPVLGPLQMPAGGAISGVVQRANGQRVTNVGITVSSIAGIPDEVAMSAVWDVDAAGRYHATGLWPGTYRVCATTPCVAIVCI